MSEAQDMADEITEEITTSLKTFGTYNLYDKIGETHDEFAWRQRYQQPEKLRDALTLIVNKNEDHDEYIRQALYEILDESEEIYNMLRRQPELTELIDEAY